MFQKIFESNIYFEFWGYSKTVKIIDKITNNKTIIVDFFTYTLYLNIYKKNRIKYKNGIIKLLNKPINGIIDIRSTKYRTTLFSKKASKINKIRGSKIWLNFHLLTFNFIKFTLVILFIVCTSLVFQSNHKIFHWVNIIWGIKYFTVVCPLF